MLSPVLRFVVAAIGGLGLLLGVISVFSVFNQVGSVALFVIGLVFSLLAIIGRVPGVESVGGGVRGRSAVSDEAMAELLASADPRVKRAAAEAVLERQTTKDGKLDAKDAALAVLLERDSIRRLHDMLLRYDFTVTTGESAGQQAAGADLLVGDPKGGGPVPVELVANRPDTPTSLQRLGSLADLLGGSAAIVVHTGARGNDTPLPTVTPIGNVQVFSVHSSRLVDEAEIISAVQRALALGRADTTDTRARDADELDTPGRRGPERVALRDSGGTGSGGGTGSLGALREGSA